MDIQNFHNQLHNSTKPILTFNLTKDFFEPRELTPQEEVMGIEYTNQIEPNKQLFALLVEYLQNWDNKDHFPICNPDIYPTKVTEWFNEYLHPKSIIINPANISIYTIMRQIERKLLNEIERLFDVNNFSNKVTHTLQLDNKLALFSGGQHSIDRANNHTGKVEITRYFFDDEFYFMLVFDFVQGFNKIAEQEIPLTDDMLLPVTNDIFPCILLACSTQNVLNFNAEIHDFFADLNEVNNQTLTQEIHTLLKLNTKNSILDKFTAINQNENRSLKHATTILHNDVETSVILSYITINDIEYIKLNCLKKANFITDKKYSDTKLNNTFIIYNFTTKDLQLNPNAKADINALNALFPELNNTQILSKFKARLDSIFGDLFTNNNQQHLTIELNKINYYLGKNYHYHPTQNGEVNTFDYFIVNRENIQDNEYLFIESFGNSNIPKPCINPTVETAITQGLQKYLSVDKPAFIVDLENTNIVTNNAIIDELILQEQAISNEISPEQILQLWLFATTTPDKITSHNSITEAYKNLYSLSETQTEISYTVTPFKGNRLHLETGEKLNFSNDIYSLEDNNLVVYDRILCCDFFETITVKIQLISYIDKFYANLTFDIIPLFIPKYSKYTLPQNKLEMLNKTIEQEQLFPILLEQFKCNITEQNSVLDEFISELTDIGIHPEWHYNRLVNLNAFKTLSYKFTEKINRAKSCENIDKKALEILNILQENNLKITSCISTITELKNSCNNQPFEMDYDLLIPQISCIISATFDIEKTLKTDKDEDKEKEINTIENTIIQVEKNLADNQKTQEDKFSLKELSDEFKVLIQNFTLFNELITDIKNHTKKLETILSKIKTKQDFLGEFLNISGNLEQQNNCYRKAQMFFSDMPADVLSVLKDKEIEQISLEYRQKQLGITDDTSVFSNQYDDKYDEYEEEYEDEYEEFYVDDNEGTRIDQEQILEYLEECNLDKSNICISFDEYRKIFENTREIDRLLTLSNAYIKVIKGVDTPSLIANANIGTIFAFNDRLKTQLQKHDEYLIKNPTNTRYHLLNSPILGYRFYERIREFYSSEAYNPIEFWDKNSAISYEINDYGLNTDNEEFVSNCFNQSVKVSIIPIDIELTDTVETYAYVTFTPLNPARPQPLKLTREEGIKCWKEIVKTRNSLKTFSNFLDINKTENLLKDYYQANEVYNFTLNPKLPIFKKLENLLPTTPYFIDNSFKTAPDFQTRTIVIDLKNIDTLKGIKATINGKTNSIKGSDLGSLFGDILALIESESTAINRHIQPNFFDKNAVAKKQFNRIVQPDILEKIATIYDQINTLAIGYCYDEILAEFNLIIITNPTKHLDENYGQLGLLYSATRALQLDGNDTINSQNHHVKTEHYWTQLLEEITQEAEKLSIEYGSIFELHSKEPLSALEPYWRSKKPNKTGVILTNLADNLDIPIELIPKGNRFDAIEIRRYTGNPSVFVCFGYSKNDFDKVVEYIETNVCDNEIIGSAWGSGYYWIEQLLDEAKLLKFIKSQKYYSKESWETASNPDLARLLFDLTQNEYHVELQPQVMLQKEEGKPDWYCHGAEALIRRTDKTTFPDEFVPIFEKEGIVRHIDFFVLETVCKNLQIWKEKYNKTMRISVNLSRVTLLEPNIVASVVEICDKYNVAHEQVMMEITERVGLIQNEVSEKLVQEFKDNQFKVSLDDFGSDTSNLSALSKISVDEVKVDKGLVDYIADSLPSDDVKTVKKDKVYKMVDKVITMCNAFEPKPMTLAEGIENEEQALTLRSFDCLLGQGYYFAKPMSINEFFNKYISE